MRRVSLLLLLLILVACGTEGATDKSEVDDAGDEVDKNTAEDLGNEPKEKPKEIEEKEEIIELTAREELIQDLVLLFDEGLAFDTGSYVKGDIPKGEYVFSSFDDSGEYYSEEDASGDIIDNENFSSFGYVQVHEAGNLKTKGVLVNIEALENLEVSGAKELYEILNEVEDFSDAGWYKVGTDIDAGEYVIESYGSGYVAVMSGPVGDSSIVTNDNFDGRYSVNVEEGQYLNISRATILE